MAAGLTVLAGAAAGTSPPTPVVQTGTRDDAGLVWVGTGTATTTGTLLTILFGANYSSAVDAPAVPRITVTFYYPSSTAAASTVYVSSVTQRQIVISVTGTALPISLPASSGGLGVTWKMDA